MKSIHQHWLGLVCGIALLAAGSVAAAEKSYQVTGPVLEVSATSITVQKGEEKWQIARSADTKGGADVKVGDKVTVYYTMTAKEIEVKDGKAAEGKKKGKGKK